MAKVSFYDEIFIESNARGGLELLCKGPCWAPAGKDNLVYQAATAFMDVCGARADIKITLTKNIPAGSGLGSASSDAAATVIGLNEYLDAGLPRRDLRELAARLGSDAPFFVDGPLALCTGRGEKIKKLAKKFNFLALLILPDVNISTEKVYANYRHNRAVYEKLSDRINNYIEKNRIDLVSNMCANMLQTSCFDLVTGLAELKAKVESLGIKPLCLSGSGSGMFHLIDDADEQTARAYKHKLEERVGCKSMIVTDNRW
jgi:4-diphosphocytidyl-2-C-methyl-D-erythritol kinase